MFDYRDYNNKRTQRTRRLFTQNKALASKYLNPDASVDSQAELRNKY